MKARTPNLCGRELFILVAFAWALASACGISNDDRCGGDDELYFDPDDGKCHYVTETSADGTATQSGTDGRTDEDTDLDGGDETETSAPNGLGEPCKAMSDCFEFEASYCLIAPGEASGSCTFSGCSTNPNDCPSGYDCCDFPDNLEVPNFCMESALYPLGGMCQ